MAEALSAEVRDLSLVYRGRGRDVIALSEVSLGIAQGEFVSLIGPSGCGKSTLLRVLGDLLTPTQGTVSIKGRTPRAERPIARTSSCIAARECLWRESALAKLVGLHLAPSTLKARTAFLPLVRQGPAQHRARACPAAELDDVFYTPD